jgi:two-component system, sensor histidine kinase and response regulator
MTKILVIEDEAPLRETMLDIFQFSAFQALGASSGREGLSLIQQQRPDLILCDIMMPDMDGHQILELVRADPNISTTPFIFVSALSDRRTVRTGMEHGADDYITKPFTTEELLTAVHARLKRHREIIEETEHQLEDVKQQLARMVTHELRTPLVSINTVVDVISRQSGQLSASELNELLDVINQGSRRLSHRVEQLTFLTQLETSVLTRDVIETKGVPMQLWDMLVAASNVARRFAFRQQGEVNLNLIDTNRDVSVACNPAALKHALAELIANAVMFSPENAEVRIVQKLTDQGVRISITDSGPGIPKDKLTAALEPFHQIDRQNKEQQGMGIGLSLAQRIIQVHGGMLEIRSVVGKGTQVLVYLPVASNF